jgi:hypothetical protein
VKQARGKDPISTLQEEISLFRKEKVEPGQVNP